MRLLATWREGGVVPLGAGQEGLPSAHSYPTHRDPTQNLDLKVADAAIHCRYMYFMGGVSRRTHSVLCFWGQAPHMSSRSDFTQFTSTLGQVSTFGTSGYRSRAVGRIAFLQ